MLAEPQWAAERQQQALGKFLGPLQMLDRLDFELERHPPNSMQLHNQARALKIYVSLASTVSLTHR